MAYAYDASVVQLTRRIEALEQTPHVVDIEARTGNQGPEIQAALDSGLGSPVLVRLGPGTFTVWPAPANDTYPGKNCLEIRYSNVTLEGAGRNLTTISCLVAGGLDPNTNWEIVHVGATPYVWRGNGIELSGSTISSVALRGLRLYGGSPRNLTTYPIWGAGVTPGVAFPADTSTGENWDITNKGVLVGNGTTRSDIVIEDCEIDSWRGENVYYGGSTGLQGLMVRRCQLHDSIGSVFSCSGGLTVEDCEIWYGENGIENDPHGSLQIIQRNVIRDAKHGVTVPTNASAPVTYEGTIVRHNRIVRHYLWGLAILNGVRGVRCYENEIADCPNSGCVLIGGHSDSGPADITLERNVFRSESFSPSLGINANSDPGYPAKAIRIIGNRTERSRYAISQGWTLTGIDLAGNLDAGSEFYQSGNDFTGTY